MGTHGLHVPASRVGYVPEAQGGSPPGSHVLYVLGTHISHGRTVRTAHRGTPGTHPVFGPIINVGGQLVPLQMLQMQPAGDGAEGSEVEADSDDEEDEENEGEAVDAT